MEAFYRNLVDAGKQRSATINHSLRQAKLTLVSQHQHPYYWPSFVLDGKDQPLPISSRHSNDSGISQVGRGAPPSADAISRE
jgi:hypothetical protein